MDDSTSDRDSGQQTQQSTSKLHHHPEASTNQQDSAFQNTTRESDDPKEFAEGIHISAERQQNDPKFHRFEKRLPFQRNRTSRSLEDTDENYLYNQSDDDEPSSDSERGSDFADFWVNKPTGSSRRYYITDDVSIIVAPTHGENQFVKTSRRRSYGKRPNYLRSESYKDRPKSYQQQGSTHPYEKPLHSMHQSRHRSRSRNRSRKYQPAERHMPQPVLRRYPTANGEDYRNVMKDVPGYYWKSARFATDQTSYSPVERMRRATTERRSVPRSNRMRDTLHDRSRERSTSPDSDVYYNSMSSSQFNRDVVIDIDQNAAYNKFTLEPDTTANTKNDAEVSAHHGLTVTMADILSATRYYDGVSNLPVAFEYSNGPMPAADQRFRWIHCQKLMKDLNGFERLIRTIADLTQIEQVLCSSLVRHIRRFSNQWPYDDVALPTLVRRFRAKTSETDTPDSQWVMFLNMPYVKREIDRSSLQDHEMDAHHRRSLLHYGHRVNGSAALNDRAAEACDSCKDTHIEVSTVWVVLTSSNVLITFSEDDFAYMHQIKFRAEQRSDLERLKPQQQEEHKIVEAEKGIDPSRPQARSGGAQSTSQGDNASLSHRDDVTKAQALFKTRRSLDQSFETTQKISDPIRGILRVQTDIASYGGKSEYKSRYEPPGFTPAADHSHGISDGKFQSPEPVVADNSVTDKEDVADEDIPPFLLWPTDSSLGKSEPNKTPMVADIASQSKNMRDEMSAARKSKHTLLSGLTKQQRNHMETILTGLEDFLVPSEWEDSRPTDISFWPSIKAQSNTKFDISSWTKLIAQHPSYDISTASDGHTWQCTLSTVLNYWQMVLTSFYPPDYEHSLITMMRNAQSYFHNDQLTMLCFEPFNNVVSEIQGIKPDDDTKQKQWYIRKTSHSLDERIPLQLRFPILPDGCPQDCLESDFYFHSRAAAIAHLRDVHRADAEASDADLTNYVLSEKQLKAFAVADTAHHLLLSMRDRLFTVANLIHRLRQQVAIGRKSDHRVYHQPQSIVKALDDLSFFMIDGCYMINDLYNIWQPNFLKDYTATDVQTYITDNLTRRGRDVIFDLEDVQRDLNNITLTKSNRVEITQEDVGPGYILVLVLLGLGRISRTSLSSEWGDCDIVSEYIGKIEQLKLRAIIRPQRRFRREMSSMKHELSMLSDIYAERVGFLNDLRTKLAPTRFVQRNRSEYVLEGQVLNDMHRNTELVLGDLLEQQRVLDEMEQKLAQDLNIEEGDEGKAILIFTITTIIFLPLSFVTSYLGMNTADLRDMNSGQPLFWAIALPLTFVTMALALIIGYKSEQLREFTVDLMYWMYHSFPWLPWRYRFYFSLHYPQIAWEQVR